MICLSIACSMSEKIHIERKNPFSTLLVSSIVHYVSAKLVYLVIWYTNCSGVLVFLVFIDLCIYS